MGLVCWVGWCGGGLGRYLILGVGHGCAGQTEDLLGVPWVFGVVEDEDVLG